MDTKIYHPDLCCCKKLGCDYFYDWGPALTISKSI